jgi:hypothetical protein
MDGHHRQLVSRSLALVVLLAVGACGGGSASSPDSGPEVPDGGDGPGERAIAATAADEVLPHVVSGTGGTWVTWFSGSMGEDRIDWVLRAQHFDPGGTPSFAAEGIEVGSPASVDWVQDHVLLLDPSGDAVILAVSTSDLIVRAHRLAPDGAKVWAEGGVPLSAAGAQASFLSAFLTPAGALVAAWTSEDVDGATAVLTRVDATGAVAGQPLAIAAEPDEVVLPVVVAGPGEDALLAWVTTPSIVGNDDRALFVQRFDVGGAPVWAEPVRLNGTLPQAMQNRHHLLADGDGGVWVAWGDIENVTRFAGSLQHLDADGQIGLPADGLRLSADGSHNQIPTALALVPGTDELAIAWTDMDLGQVQHGLSLQVFDRTGARRFDGEALVLAPLGERPVSAAAIRQRGGALVVVYGETVDRTVHVTAASLADLDAPEPDLTAISTTATDKTQPDVDGDAGWVVWADREGTFPEQQAADIHGVRWAP